MPIYNGTSNSDTIEGSNLDDTINALNGSDVVSGEGGDDLINAGEGSDLVYGDSGSDTPGQDASALSLQIGNVVSQTYTGSSASAGDSAIYSNVAQLADGTPISGRLVLVSKSDSRMTVDLTGGNGYEILMNGRGSGDNATFRLEFFDPATGDPVALNSVATFNDLDSNSPTDLEAVTLDSNIYSHLGVDQNTVLDVSEVDGIFTVKGNGNNSPSDEEAWLNAHFQDRTFIEFTLETRDSNSGFTFPGIEIVDPTVIPMIPGNDTIFGGGGQDTIFGQRGDDSLSGGDGGDSIDGGEGDDTISGDEGQDTLIGGAGNDAINTGSGDDRAYGGEGDDTITAGSGNDRLEGGTGSDTFTFESGGGHTVIGGEDADGTDIDVLDLSGMNFNLIETGAESGRVEFLDSFGNVMGRMDYSEIEQVIICFTPGTLIATNRGEIAVEKLKEGDKVFTRDNGSQPLRWVGRRDLSADDLANNPEFQPVYIRAGALGKGVPERDLMVSPNHRMLLTSDLAEVMFEEREVLVAAKHLTGLDGVDQIEASSVSYIHLMFDQHEVVLADGAWTESFQPGDHSLRGIGADQRNEILALFPELNTLAGLQGYGSARMSLKKHEARLLTDQLLSSKNR